MEEEEEEEEQAASSYLTDSAFTNPRSMDQMLVREVESNQTVALSICLLCVLLRSITAHIARIYYKGYTSLPPCDAFSYLH